MKQIMHDFDWLKGKFQSFKPYYNYPSNRNCKRSSGTADLNPNTDGRKHRIIDYADATTTVDDDIHQLDAFLNAVDLEPMRPTYNIINEDGTINIAELRRARIDYFNSLFQNR